MKQRRSITLTMEAAQDPKLVQAAKDGDIELLRSRNALADTSGDFDGLVILRGINEDDKKAIRLLELNGMDGMYYRSGKPDFGPVSLFEFNIPNMGTTRGNISQYYDGTGSNYGQFKQGVAEEIFHARGDYDTLLNRGVIPSNQTRYTADRTQEFLDSIRRNYGFEDIAEIRDIHTALGSYIYNNGYTIHEAFDPLTQSPPRILNSRYNHEGGVADSGRCKKK